jgi:signal transduction histidine kinase/CheY-like chemotaxis protein
MSRNPELQAAAAPAAVPPGGVAWRHSIRARLMAVVLVTMLVALGVALGAMVTFDLQASRRLWIDDMSTQADLLGQSSAPALAFDDARVATENLGLLHYRPQVRAAAVYDARGRLFATWAAQGEAATFAPRPDAEGIRVDDQGLTLTKRIVVKGETLGSVYLRSRSTLRDRIGGYLGIALGVAVLALLVAGAFSYWLQALVTRPILAIEAIAGDVVARRDYSRRAERISNDEVGRLVDSFNRMMGEIERHSNESAAMLREVERRVADRTAELQASNRELAEATSAAERANRAKSDFLSSMSHELRTPLNAIMGFGQLLTNETVVLPEAKKREFLNHIVNAGAHLLALINEILDLARIESSTLLLSVEPVALDDVLQECRTMIAPSAQRRAIGIDFPQQEAAWVVADRTRLKQVLLNLLSNAVKYNHDGGSVAVEVGAETDGGVRVTVTDTGCGLRPDQLAALFQPFNRLGQEAGEVEGTGIGLVVTRRLVELMGGSIDVRSAPGEGSVFSIVLKAAQRGPAALPRAAPELPRPALRAVPRTPALRPLALHVEDNPANLRLVREILDMRGDLRQMAAPDARLGLELARAHRPQLILMDVNLPGLSGLEALALLKSDPATARIPVIALTANAMAGDVSRGVAAGFFRYVTKPIDVMRLNEAVDAGLAAAALDRDSA